MTSSPSVVSIHRTDRFEYPSDGPFHPEQVFPEYPFQDPTPLGDNRVYGAVRQMLASLDLDRDRFGTPEWNPLGAMLQPGQGVVIKPNLVISEHEQGLEGLIASVAHGSVIRPIIDYAYRAVGPGGHITIADSPIKEVDFDKITRLNGIQAIVAFYASRGIAIELLDIRDLQAYRDANGVILGYRPLSGDPLGYRIVDLGSDSLLARVPAVHHRRFRSTAAIYENEAVKHHTETVNEYSMPRSILEADALISIAKLKVHRKAGVTLSLKNMVGTTNEKRWLPHHRAGTPSQGGDMTADAAPTDRKVREIMADFASRSRYGKFLRLRVYPLIALAYRRLVKPWLSPRGGESSLDFHEGDWHGNDTIWRTTLDLNAVIRYADKEGRLQRTPQRGYLSLIDGIIGGEREGPLHPSPKATGLLVGGLDPVAVDLACATLMGFDARGIPTIARAHETAYRLGTNRSEEILLRANRLELQSWDGLRAHHAGFIPPRGWEGVAALPPVHAAVAGAPPEPRQAPLVESIQGRA